MKFHLSDRRKTYLCHHMRQEAGDSESEPKALVFRFNDRELEVQDVERGSRNRGREFLGELLGDLFDGRSLKTRDVNGGAEFRVEVDGYSRDKIRRFFGAKEDQSIAEASAAAQITGIQERA